MLTPVIKVVAKKSTIAEKIKELKNTPAKTAVKNYIPQIRSRHPSHEPLRIRLQAMPFRSLIRLGSTTPCNLKMDVELNSIEAIKTSSNKFLMKQAFDTANITSAEWGYAADAKDLIAQESLKYPIIIKNIMGSRNSGNHFIQNDQELESFFKKHNNVLNSYIVEQYHNYSREYRIHIDCYGNVIYTNRKRLKRDTDDNSKWFLNDSNSVWFLETSPEFEKPKNWDKIVQQAHQALLAVGLDFGAIDLRVQGEINSKGEVRKDPKFIIIEINSAPRFGEGTTEKYINHIPTLLTKKFNSK